MNAYNIHVIGIGGLGSKMIAFIQQKGIKAKYSYINDETLSGIKPDTNFIEFIPKGEYIIKNGYKILRNFDGICHRIAFLLGKSYQYFPASLLGTAHLQQTALN